MQSHLFFTKLLKLGFQSRTRIKCEICGEVVRETVIFGDYIVLDHVSTAHIPSFLLNSQDQVMRQEEENSQNYIKMGEDWC